MASKKKNSRNTLESKHSYSDPNRKDSSSPSAVSSEVSSSFNPDHEDLLSSLDEASAKFPFFISSTAFIGRIMDDTVSNSRGCKIWLSESAMISSSISPGSLVSANWNGI